MKKLSVRFLAMLLLALMGPVSVFAQTVTEFSDFTTEQDVTYQHTTQLAAYAQIDVNSYNSGTCDYGVLSKSTTKTCSTDTSIISNVDMNVTFTPTQLKLHRGGVDHIVGSQYIHAQAGNVFGISNPDINPSNPSDGNVSTTQSASLTGILYQMTGEANPWTSQNNPAGTYTATVTIAVSPIP